MRSHPLAAFSLALLLLIPAELHAMGERGPGQFPAYTREGGLNLVNEWTEAGGARLHWNAVSVPLQIRLVGLNFTDPAALPELCTDCPDVKKERPGKKRRRSYRRSSRKKPQAQRKPRRTNRPQVKPQAQPAAPRPPRNVPLSSVPMEPVSSFQDRLQ